MIFALHESAIQEGLSGAFANVFLEAHPQGCDQGAFSIEHRRGRQAAYLVATVAAMVACVDAPRKPVCEGMLFKIVCSLYGLLDSGALLDEQIGASVVEMGWLLLVSMLVCGRKNTRVVMVSIEQYFFLDMPCMKRVYRDNKNVVPLASSQEQRAPSSRR